LAIAQRGSLRRRRPDADFGDVTQQQRRAALGAEHDITEISDADSPSRADQRVLFGCVLDVAAAEIRIVLLDAAGDVVKSKTVLRQQGGIDNNLVLLGLSAPGVDFTYAR